MALHTAPTIEALDSTQVSSPVTGQVIGVVPRHTADDVARAVSAARAAQPAWATLSYRQRAAIFRRFHDLILARHAELFDLLQAEAGKSRRDAFVELFAVASEARYYVYHGGRALRPRRAGPAIPIRDSARVIYRPIGVVGIISPWNFPFILAAADLTAALLAGNAVVLKPASLTPLTAVWMRDRLVECGLPAGLLQVVTGPGSVLGDALVDHADFVMFTGSASVGRRVAERAAHRLIPFNMELGSKNAVIILPDANLRHAAQIVVEGTFNNCGQVCINYERLYVHASIYDAFLDEVLRQTRALRLGCEPTFGTDVGSLIGEEQLRTVEAHVADAVQKGAQVLIGGRRRPDLGPYFYEPTILSGITPGMTLHSEETFGPVLSVYRFETVEEAIRLANDTRYGLHFGVATRNRRLGHCIAEQLDAGTVVINDSYTAWAAMGAPMGGFKESGLGRRHGPEGIRRFTEPQTIFTNHTFWQVGSGETALAINDTLARILLVALRLWRHIPLIR
jgi:succinate-semialdehyde dehydrogenase/glutarate-semialdehyde dehydrogenase